MNYPIADLVVRIKNAYKARKESLVLPHSIIKEEICSLLKRDGFIKDFRVLDGQKGTVSKNIEILLSYFGNSQPTIINIEITSTPAIRYYKRVKDIKPYKNGLGVELFSTSNGIMSDVECREKNVGGMSLLRVF